MLQNADPSTLTVRQIAQHLGTREWNVTHELSLGKQGHPGRLRGVKVRGVGGGVGRGGQWRVDREAYLSWLGVPEADRDDLGENGLPRLYPEAAAAAQLDLSEPQLRRALLRLSAPHLMVGWRRYLTRNQLAHLRVLLAEDCRGNSR